MPISGCRHQRLVLLAPQGEKRRCRHCHLTINSKELADGFCPECHAVHGVKRWDFDRFEPEHENRIRYRCEKCGAIIEG